MKSPIVVNFKPLDKVLKKKVMDITKEEEEERPPNTPSGKPVRPLEVYRIVTVSILASLRAYIVTVGVRGGFAVVMTLLAKFRKGRNRIGGIRAFALGEDGQRMAGVFSGFTFVWKFLSKILPRINRLDRRTNGFIAGSLAGLCLFVEKPSKRLEYSHAILFRAFQSIYHILNIKGKINIPYASQLFFITVTSQALYSFALHPETLPHSIYKFILNLSLADPRAFTINRDLITGKLTDTEPLLGIISKKSCHEGLVETISGMKSLPPVLPCSLLHQSNSGCYTAIPSKMFKSFRFMLPVYGAVNLSTKIILSSSKLKKNPTKEILNVITRSIRSGVFASMFSGTYMSFFCFANNIHHHVPGFRHHRMAYGLMGILSCVLSQSVENTHRISTLAYFVAPKALDSFYRIARSQSMLPYIPNFEVATFSFSMGVLMSCLKNDPDSIDSLMGGILKHMVDAEVDPGIISKLLGIL